MRLAEYDSQASADAANAPSATAASASRAAELAAGLADPTRVRLLNLLAAGELCVCDLVGVLALPQPTVSRHLAYLRRVGWVEATRGPRLAHYRLSEPRDALHAGLLAWVRESLPSQDGLSTERAEGAVACDLRRRSPC
jgi:ArsR family transcriptional regulator